MKKMKKYKKTTYKSAIIIFTLFTSTALVANVIGEIIDNQFEIKPYGTLLSFLVFYMISWLIIGLFLKKPLGLLKK